VIFNRYKGLQRKLTLGIPLLALALLISELVVVFEELAVVMTHTLNNGNKHMQEISQVHHETRAILEDFQLLFWLLFPL